MTKYIMVLVERAKVLYRDEYYRLGIDNMVESYGKKLQSYKIKTHH